MPVDFGNVKSDAGLAKLNEYMLMHAYVEGFAPSFHDVTTANKCMGAPSANKFPNAARWYKHIMYSFTEAEKAALLKAQPAKPAETKADDFDDLFDNVEDVDFSKKAADLKVAATAADKPKKAKDIAKSSLVIDINPSGTDVDLDKLLADVRAIDTEGVTWNVAAEKVAVAFGLHKLRVSCTVVDDLVNTEELCQKIEVLGMPEERAKVKIECLNCGEDYEPEGDEEPPVASVAIVSFSKL